MKDRNGSKKVWEHDKKKQFDDRSFFFSGHFCNQSGWDRLFKNLWDHTVLESDGIAAFCDFF